MLGLKNIKAENALDPTRDIKVQIQEAEQTSDDTYLKKSRLRHFSTKPQRTKDRSPASNERKGVRETQLEQQWISVLRLYEDIGERKAVNQNRHPANTPSGMKERQDILK